MNKLIIIIITILIIIGGYVFYTENHPHYDCDVICEIPIDFEDYAVTTMCSGVYNHKYGPFDKIRVTIISDHLDSNMRLGNSGKLIIHKGKTYKWGYHAHGGIEFNNKMIPIGLGTIYISGYKNNSSYGEKLCYDELIKYAK